MMEIVLRDKDLPYYIDDSGVIKTTEVLPDKICGAGVNTFCITPEGFLQPCCAYPLKLGDLKKYSIRGLLDNSSTMKWIKAQKVEDFSECYKFDYCAYCQMCPGNNYIAKGTPLRPSENNCSLAKVRYNLAVKMQGGYDPLHGKELIERLHEVKIDVQYLQRIESINYRDTEG